MTVSPRPILTAAQLNRATLARQRLVPPFGPGGTASAPGVVGTLDAIGGLHVEQRPGRDVVGTLEAIGGLQAQEPASPYLALRARLPGFRAVDLDRALAARQVVKATLMRVTVHLVGADDYRHLAPVLPSTVISPGGNARGGLRGHHRLPALTAALEAFAGAAPRTLPALRDEVARLAPELPADDTWWWVRRHGTFVHVPSAVPWSFGRRPLLTSAAAWLEQPFAPVESGHERLLERYLGAFGPASIADLSAWSGLSARSFGPIVDRLRAGGRLRDFADATGRPLLDLADAPLPTPDEAAAPVPPALLPMWDSILLAHADRTRVISDADRAVVIARNGDTLASILVDGRVAGLWWTEPLPGGRTRISIEPFRPIPAADRRALEREAEALAEFVQPLEPGVYSRYRRWRPGSPAATPPPEP